MEPSSISIAIRSRGERLPPLRLERSVDAPPGTVSVQLAPGELVVRCGVAAVVEAAGVLDADGVPVAALRLREGDLEIAIQGEAPVGAGQEIMRRLSSPDSRERLQDGDTVIEEPAWMKDPANAPTRLLRVDEVAGTCVTPPEGPAASPTSPRSRGARPALLRPAVRRFALFAMLGSAFMLWLHAHRVHQARAARLRAIAAVTSTRPSPAVSAVPPPAALPASTTATAVGSSESAAVTPPAASTHSQTVRNTARKGSMTKARLAADALANGDWADALHLYDDLASEPGANAAYTQIAQSLRSRASPSR